MPDILGIGASALSAYRKQLEATGSNIVNANTEGYKRRAISLQSMGESTMLPTAAPNVAGSGVMIDKVVRASDQFLEQQLLRANASFQKSQTLSTGMQRIENAIFTMENNLDVAGQSFYDRASDLSNSPDSKPARYAFIDAGQRLSDEFNRTHQKITSEIAGAEMSISAALTLTNTLTAQIANVNSELDRRYSNNQQANDLLDQRDRLLSDLSELVDVTVVPALSGSVAVYLGETQTGAPLVDREARLLGFEKIGDQINLVFDPYTAPMAATRLNGGVLSGLMELRDQFIGLRDVVDRLSLGMSTSANQQHMQGVDMNGLPGGALFSTESLKATPSPLNTGSSILEIEVSKDSILNGSSYTAIYDANTQTWTVKSELSKATAIGGDTVVLDGLTFRFDGPPKDGDSFVAQPLRNSAASMKFIISDVTEVAAGLSIYVDGRLTNASQSSLEITDTGIRTPTPAPSSLGTLLNGAAAGELAFRRDGIAYSLLSGSSETELVSLGQVSALNFRIEPSEITSKFRTSSTNETLKLSLILDNYTSTPTNVELTLENIGEDLQSVADEINRVAEIAGHGRDFFASVNGGVLTINALGLHTVSTGVIRGPDYNGDIKTYDAQEQQRIAAAEIVVFTAEGRQLSGSQYTAEEAASLLTSANGFNTQARYQAVSSTSDYRNFGVASTNSPLVLASAPDGGTQVQINAFPRYDSGQSAGEDNGLAGSVFSLSVEGLPNVRLAGDSISGKDDVEIAELLEDRLNANGVKRSWTGALVDLSASSVERVQFTITIDEKEHDVTFTRAKDANGLLTASGTFEMPDMPDVRIGLESVGGLQRVVVTAPLRLSLEATEISISGAGGLGLTTELLETKLVAQKTSATPTILAPVILKLQTDTGPVELTINRSSGSSFDGLVSWNYVGDRLELTSFDQALRFNTNTEADRAASEAVGFIGTDLKVTRTTGNIFITTSIAEKNGTITDVSDSVSRVGYVVKMDKPLPEDLIVAVKGALDGQRVLASATSGPIVRVPPRSPDIRVKISTTGDPGQLEIFDAASGASLANRSWRPGESVNYLDLTFRVNTAARTDDEFHVVRDEVRTLDNRNALLLSGLRSSTIFEQYGGTFQEAYSLAAAKFGADVQSADYKMRSMKQSASDIKLVLEGKTGVNLDTEASDLIRYQQAYQAAAQVVSAARDMFQTILNVF
jgi:flagellar hook-associated protein 1 FlgK